MYNNFFPDLFYGKNDHWLCLRRDPQKKNIGDFKMSESHTVFEKAENIDLEAFWLDNAKTID